MWRSIDPCKSRETASIYFLLNLPAKAGQAYVLRRSPGLQILRAPFSARQESAVVPIQIEQGIGRSVLELAPDNAATPQRRSARECVFLRSRNNALLQSGIAMKQTARQSLGL